MSLYNEQITYLMMDAKSRLPQDFRLNTIDEGHYLIIDVEMSNFVWRTVEDRLAIALELEDLVKKVKETGINCVIQKS